jgi:uncharacterized protein
MRREGSSSRADATHAPIITTAAPLGPTQRIDAIDALRGLALFGVLIVNLVTEFRVSIFQQFSIQTPTQGSLDRVLETVLMIAFSEKALCLFSLLFGVGLAIQFERLAQNARRLVLLLRRLAVLLGIGLVHLFFIWDGDILVEYALAGFVVLPLLFTSQRTLLAASVIFFGLYCIVPYLPGIPQFPSQSWIMQHIAEARQAYGAGGFTDVQAFRIFEIPAILGLHIRIFARTIALFLFGAFAWRTGILREARPHRRFLFGLAVTALFVAPASVRLRWNGRTLSHLRFVDCVR